MSWSSATTPAAPPHYLAGKLKCAVITPETACTSTPPRPCWTCLTMQEAKGRLDGLKVAIIGDIAHSGGRSDILALGKLGSEVTVAGLHHVAAVSFRPGSPGDLFPG